MITIQQKQNEFYNTFFPQTAMPDLKLVLAQIAETEGNETEKKEIAERICSNGYPTRLW